MHGPLNVKSYMLYAKRNMLCGSCYTLRAIRFVQYAICYMPVTEQTKLKPYLLHETRNDSIHVWQLVTRVYRSRGQQNIKLFATSQ